MHPFRGDRSLYPRIYSVVSRIPPGRVATYGQVASQAGLPRQARLVGYALSVLSNLSSIPWHRVVNAKGMISSRSGEKDCEALQRVLLEEEGIQFGPQGAISLRDFQWYPE